ncbi:hypothetical protein [Egicoccus sp. AB-alg2]|uniref:hypothetical protein n=1 Tax=Egicoccus sp. AB-alg2 TaxID=3242693 RepID=UPI00359E0F20
MAVTEQPPAAEDVRQPPWWAITLVAFGATIVWAVRFGLSYLMVPAACEVGDWLLHAISAVALLGGGAVTALNVAWLRRPLGTQARFALLFGLTLNGFFVLVTALEGLTVFFVDSCMKGAIP